MYLLKKFRCIVYVVVWLLCGYGLGYGGLDEPEWIKQFGSTGNDTSYNIAVDTDANVYLAGTVTAQVDGNVYYGKSDICIVKYDKTGTKLWSRQYGTVEDDVAYSIAIDSLNYVYVTGSTAGNLDGGLGNYGNTDVFISKYDGTGTLIWTRQYGTNTADVAKSMAVDKTGYVYVTGNTMGNYDGNIGYGGYDVFLTKYDTDGIRVWTRTLGSTLEEYVYSIVIEENVNVYLTGTTYGSLPNNINIGFGDVYLAKYDSTGTLVWIKQFGTTATEEGKSITVDMDNNVYVTGKTEGKFTGCISYGGMSDGFLTKFNPAGKSLWTRQFGTDGTDDVGGVFIDRNQTVYVTGTVDNSLDGYPYSGGRDIILTGFSTDGDKISISQYGTIKDDVVTSLVGDKDNTVYLTGNTNGQWSTYTNLGLFDIWVIKLFPIPQVRNSVVIGTIVSDQTGGSGVSNAIVEAVQSGKVQFTTVSDTQGNYRLLISSGVYDFRVYSDEYPTPIYKTGYSINSGATTTVNFTVSQSVPTGTVDHYEIIVDTDNIVAGTQFTVIITAKNVQNYTIRDFNGTVNLRPVLAVNETYPGSGSLGVTTANFKNGTVIINNQTYTRTDTIKLKVTDTSNRTGLSNKLTFYPGYNITMDLSINPPSVINGQPTEVAVTVTDYYTNPVSNRELSFTVVKGIGILSSNTVFTDGKGTAKITFTPNLTGTGVCILRASSPGLTSVESVIYVSYLVTAGNETVVVSAEDTQTRLVIPAGRFYTDTTVNIYRSIYTDVAGGIQYELVVRDRATGLTITELTQPVRLTLHYDTDSTGKVVGTEVNANEVNQSLGLYYWDRVKWIKIPARIDKIEKTVTAEILYLSKYAIKRIDSTPTGNKFKVTVTPNPFTPNPDGIADTIYLYFDNPDQLESKLKIMSIDGSIVYEDTNFGTSFCWNGKSRFGIYLETGVYIYQITCGNNRFKGSINLAK